MDQQEVEELFFINEDGQLKTSKGKRYNPNPLKRIKKEETLSRKEFYEESETLHANGLHSPPTLFRILTHFVADHLDLVDTLIGFPEIVGKSLCDTAVIREKFKINDKNSFSITNLFSEAYEQNVLSELKVTRKSTLDKLMHGFAGLHNLTMLDLMGCNVGDDHSILVNIGQDFVSLTHLSLACNNLTSDGIRLLTAPCKMFQKGPVRLKVLNLSRNPYLSNATLKYVACFKEIELLDVSGSIITGSSMKENKRLSVLGTRDPVPAWYSPNTLCNTAGWMGDMICKWMKEEDATVLKEEQVEHDSSAVSTKGFYGKKSKRPNVRSTVNTLKKYEPRLILCKPKETLQKPGFSKGKNSSKCGGVMNMSIGKENSGDCEELFSGYLSPLPPKTTSQTMF